MASSPAESKDVKPEGEGDEAGTCADTKSTEEADAPVHMTQQEDSSKQPEEKSTDQVQEAPAAAAAAAGTSSSSSDERVEGEGGGGGEPTPADREMVDFKIVYNKQKYDVTFALDDTVACLKGHINKLTSVPVSMQKVMFKGRMRDDATLREHKVTKGSKIMVVGSTVNDVMSVAAPDMKTLREEEKKAAASSKEPLSTQKPHKTVLEKHGKPDDALPGKKGVKEPLPHQPVSGMYNKSGGKVRLTFKLENDQLWIGTKERTEKVPMGSIKAVVSEAIEGHEDYHMLGIQLGPTEASRYWVYWVPAQYVDAIKDAILGKWQFF